MGRQWVDGSPVVRVSGSGKKPQTAGRVSPGLAHRVGCFFFLKHGHADHPHLGMFGMDDPCRLDAVHLGHIGVQQLS